MHLSVAIFFHLLTSIESDTIWSEELHRTFFMASTFSCVLVSSYRWNFDFCSCIEIVCQCVLWEVAILISFFVFLCIVLCERRISNCSNESEYANTISFLSFSLACGFCRKAAILKSLSNTFLPFKYRFFCGNLGLLFLLIP